MKDKPDTAPLTIGMDRPIASDPLLPEVGELAMAATRFAIAQLEFSLTVVPKIDFSKEHQSVVFDETDGPPLNPLDDLCAAAEAYAKAKASAQRKVEDLPV